MSTMYKRFGLNLHYFKDRKIIDYIDAEKERTNLSYSDILRLLIINVIDEKHKNETENPEVDTIKKPKFKFKG